MDEPIAISIEDAASWITWKRGDYGYFVTAALKIVRKLGHPNPRANGLRVVIVAEKEYSHRQAPAVEVKLAREKSIPITRLARAASGTSESGSNHLYISRAGKVLLNTRFHSLC